MNRPRPRQGGFALVSVLWVVLLLSIVAASMVSDSRTNRALASADYDHAKAEAAAEAGIARALLTLLDSRPDHRPSTNSALAEFSFAGATVTVTIEDETGKVDLNSADDDLLRSLFRSIGLSDQAADGLFDKLADWRSGGDLHHLEGAKAEDYREKGYPYGPRNAPFDTVDELKEVMDVTPDIFKQVKDTVTVYSSRSSIDPSVAPTASLQALSQMNGGQEDILLTGKAPLVNPDASASSYDGRSFMITVNVVLKDSVRLRLETVARLTGNPHQPFWILRVKEIAN